MRKLFALLIVFTAACEVKGSIRPRDSATAVHDTVFDTVVVHDTVRIAPSAVSHSVSAPTRIRIVHDTVPSVVYDTIRVKDHLDEATVPLTQYQTCEQQRQEALKVGYDLISYFKQRVNSKKP